MKVNYYIITDVGRSKIKASNDHQAISFFLLKKDAKQLVKETKEVIKSK